MINLLWHPQASALDDGCNSVHFESAGDRSSVSMGTPFLQCRRSRGPLCTSKPQLLLRVSPATQPSTLVSAGNRLFQWEELSGRSVPCGDGDWALPLLTEVLGISLLHPLVKLSCSPYGMGLTEPLIPTSCTTQISCPQDHAQQRAVRWKSSGAPSRRTGVALGNQEHNSMLLSAALRLSPAPAPMCAEVRPELKMKSLQRYFNRDLMLN